MPAARKEAASPVRASLRSVGVEQDQVARRPRHAEGLVRAMAQRQADRRLQEAHLTATGDEEGRRVAAVDQRHAGTVGDLDEGGRDELLVVEEGCEVVAHLPRHGGQVGAGGSGLAEGADDADRLLDGADSLAAHVAHHEADAPVEWNQSYRSPPTRVSSAADR